MHQVNIFKTLGIFYCHWVLYFLELVRHYLPQLKAGSRRGSQRTSNVFLSYKVRLLTFSNYLLRQCTSFSRLFSF